MGSFESAINRYSISASGSSSATGDTTLLAVPASKRFRLISAIISPSGGVNTVILKTGAVALPAIDFAADTPFVLNYNPAGWINGAVGDDFIINLSAATATGIVYTYFLSDS